ncbi:MULTISPECIES: hypothetical protein [Basfia]|uniref:Lipoprotein n=2 Tax=Basfia TaxID=697331 RepID=Q65UZ0_MANSM|nr:MULTISPECIES: hypothetical protein [Basfia]AAU37220.1 unknown [[Mannheimia] succiniciproducens MBEL55E]QIM68063.1 hypothetical protein A4G13_00930 [Basfia succiniciproducens]SCX87281.1 hypothetical protein SAMN02910354_00667 [Basfia succiniciproducens]SEP66651.1 hypothetical protein SAMN02910415_00259 [Basfia succiniciproducens]
MKKTIIAAFVVSAGVIACSSPVENRPQAPLDMQTVRHYQNKVYGGNTVPAAQRVKEQPVVDTPMNVSDTRRQDRLDTRQTVRPGNVVIVPSIGYGYHHHRYRW